MIGYGFFFVFWMWRGPVNSPVTNLLLPLAMCKRLTFIMASGSGVFGAMPQLKEGIIYASDGRRRDDFTFPMATRLLLLDLSYNNVSWLSDLPVLTGAGRMLFRENHQIKLSPGLLARALEQQIILDLRGTIEQRRRSTTVVRGRTTANHRHVCVPR